MQMGRFHLLTGMCSSSFTIEVELITNLSIKNLVKLEHGEVNRIYSCVFKPDYVFSTSHSSVWRQFTSLVTTQPTCVFMPLQQLNSR